MILNNQRGVYERAGLGYKPNNKPKFIKNFFTASLSTSSTSHITCFSCGRVGHKIFICNIRKLNGKIIKKIQILKGIMTANPKGSKKIWVPKKVI